MIRDCRRGLSGKVYKRVTHCLFDMDGTLLNSEVIYHEVIEQLCSKFGKTYTKDMKRKLYGETDREVSKTVVEELKLPISADEFEHLLTDMTSQALPSAPLMEGAERLVSHLYDYDVPMALATNSTQQAVRLQGIARPQLFGMFHHTVSVSDVDVDRGKPQPDIYLVAASRFPDKPKPYKCLVFEDSPRGVEAANQAGMQVVMIPDRRVGRESTRRATLVIRSLNDFRPELFGLPPFVEVKIPHHEPNDLVDMTKKYEMFYMKQLGKKPFILDVQKNENGELKDGNSNLKLDCYVRNLKSKRIGDDVRKSVNIDNVNDIIAKSQKKTLHYKQRESLQRNELPQDRSDEFKP